LSLLVASLAVAKNTCPSSGTLENGSVLSANLLMPKKGTVYNVQHGGTVDVDIAGTASVGLGMNGLANLHYTYVIDTSGSTDEGICGNRKVIDCEKDAVLALHGAIKSSGAAVDYGVVSFTEDGNNIEFPNGKFVTTDSGNEDGDITNAIEALVAGGGTDFAAALDAALVSITESAASGEKRIVFVSDGEDRNPNAFEAALQPLIDAGAVINSFAVGDSSTCDSGQGELQRMADATGGECFEVADAADLEDVLLSTISSEIISLDITLNGNYLTRVEGPFDGPLSMDVDSTATFLPEGDYEACIEVIGAVGRGSNEVSESTVSTGCCVWFHIKSASHHYSAPQHYKKPVYHSRPWHYKAGGSSKRKSSKGSKGHGHGNGRNGYLGYYGYTRGYHGGY
jgi:hypothetical protein